VSDYLAPSVLSDLEMITSYNPIEISKDPAAHSHQHFCSPIADGDSDSDA